MSTETIKINSKIPEGPLAEKWTNYKAHQKLVNPSNKRRLDIIVVGTGLAGASAAATLGELGFNVLNFCIQDSPRDDNMTGYVWDYSAYPECPGVILPPADTSDDRPQESVTEPSDGESTEESTDVSLPTEETEVPGTEYTEPASSEQTE